MRKSAGWLPVMGRRATAATCGHDRCSHPSRRSALRCSQRRGIPTSEFALHYLLNGGLLEYAQQMAAHESALTTKPYDRRNDQVTLDQVERIVL
jgi:hypothetical protein